MSMRRAFWPVPTIGRGILVAVLATFLLLGIPGTARAASCDTGSPPEEGVLDFASDVEVNPDATATVRETIRVLARGQQITRDIYRDFPSHFQDSRGHVYAPAIRVIDARRDGTPVDYAVRHLPEGTRVYLGIPDSPLAPGEYTYTLTYQVTGALGFFADGDQLYWPITPSGWNVPIACATATIQVPPGVPIVGIHATGWIGQEESPFREIVPTVDRSGLVTYVAPGPLAFAHELTVAVSWPRGFVQEPVTFGQTWPLVGAGHTGSILLIGVALNLMWSAVALSRVHRRRRVSTAGPIDRPPDQLSPAAARFLTTETFDERTLAATILDLAVKGFLILREAPISNTGKAGPSGVAVPTEGSGAATSNGGSEVIYDLVRAERPGGGPRLAPEEGSALAEMFGRETTCRLSGERFRELRRASDELKRLVGALYEDRYFTHNARYLIPALLLTTIAIAAAGLSETNRASLDLRAGVIWFIVASSLVFGTAFALGAVLLMTHLKTREQALWFAAVAFAVYLIPLLVLLFVTTQIAGTPVPTVVVLGILGVTLAALRKLLATTTSDGQRARERLARFRAFLVATGRDSDDREQRWNSAWEAYLPYAAALEVDESWISPLVRAAEAESAGAAGRKGVTWYEPADPAVVAPASLSDALVVAIHEALRGPTARAGRETPEEFDQRPGRYR